MATRCAEADLGRPSSVVSVKPVMRDFVRRELPRVFRVTDTEGRLHDFSDKVNCLSWNAGTPTHLIHAYPMCPNVSPTPLNHRPTTCLSPIEGRYASIDQAHGATSTGYWRYWTNGERCVLVNDKAHGLRRTDATWVFIDRRALPRKLCTRETPAGAYRCGTT